MKKPVLTFLLSLALSLSALAPFGAATALGQEQCWDNAAIQSALDQGRIQPVAAVLAREGINPATQVLNVRVCEQGGAVVYVLAVLEASGEARNLTVSAQ